MRFGTLSNIPPAKYTYQINSFEHLQTTNLEAAGLITFAYGFRRRGSYG